jgi:small subunit ribosomal protein S17
MLENEENVNEDETPGETPAEAVDEAAAEPAAESADQPDQVAEEVVAPEEPADEPTADEVAEEAPAEETPAEEPAAEEAPAEEPAAEEAPAEAPAPAAAAPAAAAPADEAEPQERLSPKELRRRTRSTHTGEAAPPRSIEERAQERAERRQVKAKHRRAYRLKQRERRAGQPRGETPPVIEPTSPPTIKMRQGIVVSDKADKTITVRIDTARQHRMYKKIVRTSSTLHAHDENNDAHIGDTVRLIESRPLSRTKRWRLAEVLERAR